MKKRNEIRLFLMCALIVVSSVLLAVGSAWAQASRGRVGSGFNRSDISKMQDEHARSNRDLGTITFHPVEDGFDIEFEKHPMYPVTARSYLNGKKVKKDQCRGECDGMLKVLVMRMVHGQRYNANCSAPSQLPAVAKIIVPPSGGVHCYFEVTQEVDKALARIRQVGGVEALDSWELALSPGDFIKVGDCLDGHEAGTAGFASCVKQSGVRPETLLAIKNP